jgi:outer membrane protein TolC
MQHFDETRRLVKARAACFMLALTLSGGVVLSQQSAGGQTPQALPLPLSGRSSQSIGQVSTQQMTLPAGTSVLQPSVMVVGNYQGSVPGTPVMSGSLRLSMADAVKRGLQTNLGLITSDAVSSTVRAQRMQVLSQMFPQINASAGESVMQLNLASYGFNAISSAIPKVIGPFQYVQAQANVNWNALSLTNFRNMQAANSVDRATQLSARDARELVVLAVSGSYLQVISANAQIESQRRQVEYAQAIYDRANTQFRAGTNTRVDLTRSLVQLQVEQERLLSLEGDYEQQKIAFARLIGLPLDTDIVFTEPLQAKDLDTVDEAGALHAAFARRWDLRAAEEQRTAAERTLSAARGERLPSVSFNGYYGASGTHPEESHGNFAAQGTINVPIFDGGRISGDIRQAQATLRQRQAEYDDQKAKVEQDVRNALVQLRVAAGQVKLAESNRQYAQETLTQSRDRFEAGVTNTVEVVQAQQQQASAENDYISSLFAWNIARLSLARAIGDAETEVTALYPGEQH